MLLSDTTNDSCSDALAKHGEEGDDTLDFCGSPDLEPDSPRSDFAGEICRGSESFGVFGTSFVVFEAHSSPKVLVTDFRIHTHTTIVCSPVKARILQAFVDVVFLTFHFGNGSSSRR